MSSDSGAGPTIFSTLNPSMNVNGTRARDDELAQRKTLAKLSSLYADDVQGLRRNVAMKKYDKKGALLGDATGVGVVNGTGKRAVVAPPPPPPIPATAEESWVHRAFGMVKGYFVYVAVTIMRAFWAMVYYPNIIADRISLVVITMALIVVMTIFLPICLFAMIPMAVDAFNWMSEQFFGGLGIVNCSYPHIFHDLNDKERKAARVFLSQSIDYSPGSSKERVFSLDAAKLLLQCSALMYERNKQPSSHTNTASLKNAPNGITPKSHDDSTPRYPGPSHPRNITDIAREELRLEFRAVSELNSVGAAFCGLFWDWNENFVVVAFRGTNPTDYAEWTTDFSCEMKEAGKWLGDFGRVHSGFLEKIFPKEVAPEASMPYETINNAILEVVDGLRRKRDDPPVNIWVTGHSLGCALASVMYSRMICEPHELGLGSMLRDAYLFAAPIVCDARSAATFNNKVNRYFRSKPRTMWRVTNGMDVVATGLPNSGDNVDWVRSSYNSMDFAHLGCEIRLRPHPHPCIVRADDGHIDPRTNVTIQSTLASSPKFIESIRARLRTPYYLAMTAMQDIPLVGRIIAHGTGFYWNTLMVVGDRRCVWESTRGILGM